MENEPGAGPPVGLTWSHEGAPETAQVRLPVPELITDAVVGLGSGPDCAALHAAVPGETASRGPRATFSVSATVLGEPESDGAVTVSVAACEPVATPWAEAVIATDASPVPDGGFAVAHG